MPNRRIAAMFVSAFLRYDVPLPFLGDSGVVETETRIVVLREDEPQKYYFRVVRPAL
jgi:hypothetical protein